jgi:hypothetical protein
MQFYRNRGPQDSVAAQAEGESQKHGVRKISGSYLSGTPNKSKWLAFAAVLRRHGATRK